METWRRARAAGDGAARSPSCRAGGTTETRKRARATSGPSPQAIETQEEERPEQPLSAERTVETPGRENQPKGLQKDHRDTEWRQNRVANWPLNTQGCVWSEQRQRRRPRAASRHLKRESGAFWTFIRRIYNAATKRLYIIYNLNNSANAPPTPTPGTGVRVTRPQPGQSASPSPTPP